jgi:hypothetical protein
MAEPVAVTISPIWVSLINSPLMWVVWSLQGVAISFAPLFLYWSGRGEGLFFSVPNWVVVLLCFAVIVGEGFFYLSLGNHVVGQVRRKRER